MRRTLASLLILCLCSWTPSVVVAALTGTIEGYVLDESGAGVPGATVTAVAVADGVNRNAVTRADGFYHLGGLPPGVYTVTTNLPGFTTTSLSVEVRAGRATRQDVMLRVASMAETITVTAASPILRGRVPKADRHVYAPPPPPVHVQPAWNTEKYARIDESRFVSPAQQPLSTFSVDVDTASYANVRRFLGDGALPPADAVRIEELLNYFTYEYPPTPQPVAVYTETGPCPWEEEHRLVLVAVRGKTPEPKLEPLARNLVFLVDVSGSMSPPDKLPLLKAALTRLAGQLTARDRVALVVYAGAAGLVLPSTTGDRQSEIVAALDRLMAGGSTNGADGIVLAYRVARENFIPGGVNRVVLATDGDFNVGVTSEGELTRLIEKERESGVFLSVLGFGRGNLADATMEALADRGNGNYAYVDSLREAEKVLVREGAATLETVAKDVKIQVEFNPALVKAYRLIGYENRRLESEDFRDDRKDAGEVGAGGSVTALYEIVPAGGRAKLAVVGPLKYQQPPAPSSAAGGSELMTVKVRFKAPDGARSAGLETVVHDGADGSAANLAFAAAVAEVGLLLRDSPHKGRASYARALERARAARGADPHGDRAEFEALVARAAELSDRRQAGLR